VCVREMPPCDNIAGFVATCVWLVLCHFAPSGTKDDVYIMVPTVCVHAFANV
jgi:hypothetical protein